jgi:hypothetical protein
MESLEKFKIHQSSEMNNIHGGGFIHTSWSAFGMHVEDVYDDANGNGVCDKNEARLLAYVSQ